MKSEPQKEHHWLQQLVGEWTYECEMIMGPDKPSETYSGTETVRSLNGLWTLCELRGEMPGGGTSTMVITLGYDPMKKRFVGSFVGSMMPVMWVYEGTLDEAEKVLTLVTDGPDFGVEGRTTKFRDVVEIKSNDHRLFTSYMLSEDGTWQHLMTMRYRRKGSQG